MSGQLFTEYFLTDGIKQTGEWQDSVRNPEALQELRDAFAGVFSKIGLFNRPNEETTNQELIRPVFEILGWRHYLPQQSTRGGEEVPDHLLFEDQDAKNQAAAESSASARFKHASVVQESKKRGLSLDDGESRRNVRRGRTPHGQILGYLSTADDESGGKIR